MSTGAKGSDYPPGPTEWLVPTILLVSATGEFSDGRQVERLHLRAVANRCLIVRSAPIVEERRYDGRRETTDRFAERAAKQLRASAPNRRSEFRVR